MAEPTASRPASEKSKNFESALEAIESTPGITELCLDYYNMGDKGATQVSSFLKKATSVSTIQLMGNHISDKGVSRLVKAIKANKSLSLTKINLSYNSVTKSSQKLLEELTAVNPSLEITLFGNPISSESDTSSIVGQPTESSKTRRGKKNERKSQKNRRSKKSKYEIVILPEDDDDTVYLKTLENRLLTLQQNEREFIGQIEELESKILNYQDSSLTKITSFAISSAKKFTRSLPISTKNIVILQKLAEAGGSSASIYSCLVDGWLCAMKELDLSDMSQFSVDSFLTEVHLLELLPQHDNIVRYLFHEMKDNHIRLFMTLYSGSLGSYIARHGRENVPIPPAVVWRIALDICKGLHFLHSQGIIHRDLKSDNIFIITDEHREIRSCAIGDFDTAKQITSKQDQAKTVLGTPAWMAPEVMDAKDQGEYGFACDVYSFGMILYELVALQRPYTGFNPMRIPLMVLQGEKPPLPKVSPAFSKLIQLYEKCTVFDPAKRLTVKQIKSIIAEEISS